MNVCNKCKHYRRGVLGATFATCESPQNKEKDRVTGRKIYKSSRFAIEQRCGVNGGCGDVGRWFEPKARNIIAMRAIRWMSAFRRRETGET